MFYLAKTRIVRLQPPSMGGHINTGRILNRQYMTIRHYLSTPWCTSKDDPIFRHGIMSKKIDTHRFCQHGLSNMDQVSLCGAVSSLLEFVRLDVLNVCHRMLLIIGVGLLTYSYGLVMIGYFF